jgi:DNA polymerase-3 subunit alpha
MAQMAHLHLHSSYSILDSVSKIERIVQRASEFGHKSIALTDHGTIAGIPEFYDTCIKYGIKPIPACEFYMVEDHENDKLKAKTEGRKNSKNHHIILLAMNDEGWKNIKLLNTKAASKFYYAPRLDYSDLREHNNGIIALTACLKGIVPWNIAEQRYDEAARHAKILKEIFGDRFYLETQDGGLDIQPEINKWMRALGQKLDIKVVGAQDAHYVNPEDVESHEAIWAIRTNQTLDMPIGGRDEEGKDKKSTRIYYSTKEYWLKDANHILKELLTTEKGEKRKSTVTQEELERSLEIADRIGKVTIEKKMHLPKYEYIPDIKDHKGCATKGCSIEVHEGDYKESGSYGYLMDLIVQGYEKRFNKPFYEAPQVHKDRLRKELDDIKKAQLADYFLIIWDIVSWARSQKIPVGPGRGSAAGSMVSYCLGITSIDPVKYGLIWERFYNVGRQGSMADIDIDVGKRSREKVIDYIKKRFGEDRVAQMATFNSLKAKAALKDTARVLGKDGMEHDDANLMTSFVSDKPDTTIDKSLSENDKLKEYENKNPRLFSIARMLEGCPKSSGKHASGIIISDESFKSGSIPLRWDTKEKKLITEWDGETLDGLGYLKVDILGLKTMDVLDGVQKDVNGEKNDTERKVKRAATRKNKEAE